MIQFERTRPARRQERFATPGDGLMRAIAARNVSAFEMLYHAYYGLVFGISRRLLGDVTSAEDLTQIVFLKMWMNPGAFRGGSLCAWMSRVTRNAAYDVLRSRLAEQRKTIPCDVPLGASPEDIFVAEADAQRVRRAVMSLPIKERIPIEMGFVRGMTHGRVSQETGVPLGTVKTRIRAGLQRMRVVLASPPNYAP